MSIAKFEYDGLHRRIVKEQYVAGALDKTRHFYYSTAWQVLEERVDAATTAHKQFVWGARYIDDLVLRDRDADGNSGNGLEERLYVTQDALFNVTALTNSSGAVQERIEYNPYGKSRELDPDFTSYTGTDFDWEYRFTGRRLDLDTGLQYSRYRYYHATLGRFVNRDPIQYFGTDSNLYNYVHNSALNFLDPSGLDPGRGFHRRVPPPWTRWDTWRAAINLAKNRDIPEYLMRWAFENSVNICPDNSTWYDGNLWFNTIYIFRDTMRRLKLPNTSVSIAPFYNETFHAWYDQDGEHNAEWLTDLMGEETQYPPELRLHMVEEAMSEIIAALVESGNSKCPPSYDEALENKGSYAGLAPLHTDPGERFAGEGSGEDPVSESIYLSALWVMHFGSADPRTLEGVEEGASVEDALKFWFDTLE